MTNRRHLSALLTALLLLFPVGVGTATAEQAIHQRAEVLTFGDQQDVGQARLLRTDDTVHTRARLSGIEPGVYTLWWVVWNAPENCQTPFVCTDTDLFDPDVEVAIGYGAGRVVEQSGRLNLAASLREGEELTGFPTEFRIPLADELVDARHAEIHLVLRSHGEKIAGLVDEMLHTFNAGCTYTGPIEGSEPPDYGTAGPNTCEDRFFAVFTTPSIR